MTVEKPQPALLALASGEVFAGQSFGARGPAVGEVVFNTALSGYQEVLSDPSYRGQLVCMTSVHIGNVGVNGNDNESRQPQASGLIVRELARTVSNWRSSSSLAAMVATHNVAGLAGIDTRRLTRRLRSGGSVNGCILTGSDPTQALAEARSCPPMTGQDLGSKAGTEAVAKWDTAAWQHDRDEYAPALPSKAAVAVLNCGSKKAILRELAARDLAVSLLPYGCPEKDLAVAGRNGVVLSNGPGDPVPLTAAIAAARSILSQGVPLLGICLGHQILALAAGGRTVKMKFGHHGTNHPVLDHASGRVFISSQNHGFAIDPEKLPAGTVITHTSLFDGSIQGLTYRDRPALSFQGHPEASPGPRELSSIFDHFAELVRNHAQTHGH